jgi:hypothetical protein
MKRATEQRRLGQPMGTCVQRRVGMAATYGVKYGLVERAQQLVSSRFVEDGRKDRRAGHEVGQIRSLVGDRVL